ncbi:hypothetical protein SBA6_190021 [Candidatus Sulfopaludibacter sp. SbA6]|nr:hypothetical protein SBA6_190021 [Candidatus Sulfopaludibacter sp. SbA6]
MELYKSGKIGEMKLMMSYWVLGGTPPKSFKPPNLTPEDEKIRM